MLNNADIKQINESFEGEGLRILDTPRTRELGINGRCVRSGLVDESQPETVVYTVFMHALRCEDVELIK